MGDDRSALQAVVAADTELMELREEEEEINAKLQDTTLDDKTFDADEASERLNEVGPSGDGYCTVGYHCCIQRVCEGPHKVQPSYVWGFAMLKHHCCAESRGCGLFGADVACEWLIDVCSPDVMLHGI